MTDVDAPCTRACGHFGPCVPRLPTDAPGPETCAECGGTRIVGDGYESWRCESCDAREAERDTDAPGPGLPEMLDAALVAQFTAHPARPGDNPGTYNYVAEMARKALRAALAASPAPSRPEGLDPWALATIVSDALAATTEGTDYAEAPEPSCEPGSPYVMRLTAEILARLSDTTTEASDG